MFEIKGHDFPMLQGLQPQKDRSKSEGAKDTK